MAQVLILEENPSLREEFISVFRGSEHEAHVVGEPSRALGVLRENPADLVLCDVLLSDMIGRLFIEGVRRIQPHVPILVITSYPELIVAQGLEGMVAGHLAKPFAADELLEAVDGILSSKPGERRPHHGAHTTWRLKRKGAQLEVLLEISKLLNRERDLDALLKLMVELTTLVVRTDRASVFLLDPVADELWSKVAIGMESKEIRFPADQGIAGHVVRTGEPVITYDPYSDPRFNRKIDEQTGYVTRSLMACPMQNMRGELFGCFEVINKFGGEFDEQDLALVSAISTIASVAVENAQLHDAKNRKVHELRAALTKLRETREELVRSEQLATVGRMASGIAHEIRNQLVVLDFADLIRQRYPDDEKTAYYVKQVMEARQRILTIFDELSDMSSDREYTREAEDLGQLAREVADFMHFDGEVRAVGVAAEVEDGVLAMVSRDKIKQVIINLLRNAAQAYGEPRSRDALPARPGIQLGVRREGGRAQVSVMDRGQGIAPGDLSRIFEPFFSTKAKKGMGMGLDICRRIVEGHGGRLLVSSTPGQGSTFTVDLPAV